LPPRTEVALKLLHVTAPGAFGGLERVVEMLAIGTAAAGHDVTLVAILDEEAPSPAWLERLPANGVGVSRLTVPRRAYLRERRAIARYIEASAPAIVHTHGYRAAVQAGSLARRLGCPSVGTAHGFTGGGRRNQLYEWLQLRALRHYDAVIAVSQPLVALLESRGIAARRIHRIPNAAPADQPPLPRSEARRQLALAEDSLAFGWAGRLSREKGPDVAIAALSCLGRHASLVMLGEGRERAGLERLAAELGVADRVRWCGAVPDAGRFFAAFDGFILSSRTEGTPIVLFEAMRARTPIVATAVGGVPDVVSANEAFLVAPDDPPALAAALDALVADPAGASGRADAAYRRLLAERDVGRWVARHEALYRSLTAAARPLASS
jgi:glycosyltransferase involved in cell wall biosynthesis